MTAAPVERLDEQVRAWIYRMGWPGLREVQERAVAPILDRRGDLLISAGTAAGKTEAAFLPIASSLAAEDDPGRGAGLAALCVSPLKALIDDQHRRLVELGEACGFPVHRWHGDVGAGERRALLERPEGLLITTPESLEALHVLRARELGRLFGALRYVVVDELHAFLGSERGMHLASLLHRVEARTLAAGRPRPMRIGLSATLGEPAVAQRFLRPGAPEGVDVLEARGGAREVRLLLRSAGAREATVRRLYRELRGGDHLVFCNRRADVEDLVTRLASLSAADRVPDEFVAHHGSLSAELRKHAEAALRDADRPRTVVCTSTLELGIDVGDVDSVVQLGAPSTVGGLRQRLGRSGRRGGPATLRLVIEEATGALPEDLAERPADVAARPFLDRIEEELVQGVAMFELMLEGWCETPPEGALHLSTLLMQVLSVVAERSGARADALHRLLCREGPFRAVDAATFAELLRAMGARDLLTQDADGELLTGLEGERHLADHRFFAAFMAPEELTVIAGGRTVGTLPHSAPLVVGEGLALGGARWKVVAVDEAARIVVVVPGATGAPPSFLGAGGAVAGVVRARMRDVLRGSVEPPYLDTRARARLAAARDALEDTEREQGARGVLRDGRDLVVLPWCGDRALRTLSLALLRAGFDVSVDGAALRVRGEHPDALWSALGDLEAAGPIPALELAEEQRLAAREKYDEYLSGGLLLRTVAARDLDVEGAWRAVEGLLAGR